MTTLERLKLTNLLKKTVDERNAETNTLKRLKLANQVQDLRKQLGLIVAVEQNEPLTPQQNIEQSDEQAQLNRLTKIALKGKTRQELNEQFGLSERALDYFQSGYDFVIENFNDGTYYYIDGENWQEVVETEKQRLANAGIAIPTIQELLGDVDYLTKEYWQERLVSTVSFIKKVRDNISSNRKAYLNLNELGKEMAKQELALKNPELSFVAMVNYGSELRKIQTENGNTLQEYFNKKQENKPMNPKYTQDDIAYMQSIIDGTLDLETVDMDKMIEIGEKDEHDPMYEQALQIVSDYLDEMSK